MARNQPPPEMMLFSKEAEQATLGSIIIDPVYLDSVTLHIAGPEDFYIEVYRTIYKAILKLRDNNIGIDTITVGNELDRMREENRTKDDLAIMVPTLVTNTPVSFHAEYYAKIVGEYALARRIVAAGTKVVQLAHQGMSPGELIDASERVMTKAIASRRDLKYSTMSELVSREFDRQEKIMAGDTSLQGLPTGFVDLDDILGGLKAGDMIVLGGRPGMAKTAMAVAIASNVAKLKKRVALFSLEMEDAQIAQRAIAVESDIPLTKLRQGVSDDEWKAFLRSINELDNDHIVIDHTPAISISYLKSQARSIHASLGLDLIIVDYLQLMRAGFKTENRQNEISEISRAIKGLARELGIPILALSQLSRAVESRTDKRPKLSDLRESGSIEQDSDIVMFIYRDVIYNEDTEFRNVAEIIVGKFRNGPTGTVELFFKEITTGFKDLLVRVEPL